MSAGRICYVKFVYSVIYIHAISCELKSVRLGKILSEI